MSGSEINGGSGDDLLDFSEAKTFEGNTIDGGAGDDVVLISNGGGHGGGQGGAHGGGR